MLTLLSKYEDYKINGTNPPEEVINKTSSYKQDSIKLMDGFIVN